MSEERVRELERELHERDKRDFKELKAKLDLVLTQLAVIREEFAKQTELEALETRVAKLEPLEARIAQLEALVPRVAQLEAERLKILGGFAVMQVIGAVLLAVILRLWK